MEKEGGIRISWTRDQINIMAISNLVSEMDRVFLQAKTVKSTAEAGKVEKDMASG